MFKFVVVNHENLCSHLVSLLHKRGLTLHSISINRRAREHNVEAEGGKLVTVGIAKLIHCVEDHDPGLWTTSVACGERVGALAGRGL